MGLYHVQARTVEFLEPKHPKYDHAAYSITSLEPYIPTYHKKYSFINQNQSKRSIPDRIFWQRFLLWSKYSLVWYLCGSTPTYACNKYQSRPIWRTWKQIPQSDSSLYELRKRDCQRWHTLALDKSFTNLQSLNKADRCIDDSAVSESVFLSAGSASSLCFSATPSLFSLGLPWSHSACESRGQLHQRTLYPDGLFGFFRIRNPPSWLWRASLPIFFLTDLAVPAPCLPWQME